MTTRQAVTILAFGMAALVVLPGQALGQAPYRPSSPTFSPWLNLQQRNTGALDNYHTYVRPEFELRNNLRQQAAVNQNQAAGIRSLSDRVGNLKKAEVAIRPTGTASVFNNYSHYYHAGSGQGGAKSRGTSRR